MGATCLQLLYLYITSNLVYMKRNTITTTTVCGKSLGTRLQGKEQYAKLYHYTSFETFVKIWLSKKLKFGVSMNVNDINEAKKLLSMPCSFHPDDIKRNVKLIRMFGKELSLYKQISLAKDYDSYLKGYMSPMMWGHYGDKWKGVCIELDFDKLSLTNDMVWGNVTYTNRLTPIELPYELDNEMKMNKFILKNRKKIFFTKSNDWKGENEFRIVSKNNDYFDITNAVSAIYVTDCHSEVCKFIEELVKDNIEVKLFCYIQQQQPYSRIIPISTNAKARREQEETAKNNPNNILNTR